MLEWYEAYADYRDTMARIEAAASGRAAQRDAAGRPRSTFRGHEVDFADAVAARLGSWRRSSANELWTRDADELRAWLDERGVDTSRDTTWAQLVDHAFSHFVEPELVEPTIVYD